MQHVVTYSLGDVVMAKVEYEVRRVVYQSKGLFVVVETAGFSSYQVHRYDKTNSTLRKLMT